MPDIPVWQDMEFAAGHALHMLDVVRSMSEPISTRLTEMDAEPWRSGDFPRDTQWCRDVAECASVTTRLLKQLTDSMPVDWTK